VKKRIEFLELDTSHFKIRKPSGIKKDGQPNAFWRKFKESLADYENTPVEKWEAKHLLGHILKRYNERYQIEFTLSYSRPPSKSQELYCVKRMMTSFGSAAPSVLKQYIDWMFDGYLKKNPMKSLALFFHQGMIGKFKAQYKKSNQISRSTQLPSQYSDIVEDLKLPIFTYGDVAFAKMAVDGSPDEYPDYVTLLTRLHNAGLDDALLEQLEEG